MMAEEEITKLVKKINSICDRLHKKTKKEMAENFSTEWLSNHGLQILLSILSSYSSRVIHEYIDVCVKEEFQEEAFNDLAPRISDAIIEAHKKLRLQEMQ